MHTVLITGGTGTIGKKLSNLLIIKGYNVIILSRRKMPVSTSDSRISYAKWDVEKGEIEPSVITRCDYIINLAGANIAAQRWTKKRKTLIRESRIQSSLLLVKALKEIPNNVKAIISASGAAYYGPDNLLSLHDGFTEDDKPGNDFLASVCEQWEEAIASVQVLNKRYVVLRTGLVLSKQGGLLTNLLKPLQYGVAVILGNGKQMVSWIHELDICNLYIYAMEHEEMNGPYNAVAPFAVTQRELVMTLAQARHRMYIPLNVPGFILKLVMGELAGEVLKSTHLSSSAVEENGFRFSFPKLEIALKNLLH